MHDRLTQCNHNGPRRAMLWKRREETDACFSTCPTLQSPTYWTFPATRERSTGSQGPSTRKRYAVTTQSMGLCSRIFPREGTLELHFEKYNLPAE